MIRTRLFSEADVQRIVRGLVGSHPVMRARADAVIAAATSELTEEVVAVSEVRRLVALATTPRGCGEAAADLPGAVWDELSDRGLVQTIYDASGEGFTDATTPGCERLREVLSDG